MTFSRAPNIVFWRNKEYASRYSQVLILRKSITIRDLSFFQTTNVNNAINKMIFKQIFCN